MFKKIIKKIIIHTHPNYYLKIRSQRSGYFEREVEFLDTFCDKSKIALDIGASLGTYSYLMLQHSKKVIAIEPLKEKCQKLDYLFRNLENFEVLNIAVSDKIDEKQIRVPLGDTGRSTIENSNNLLDVKTKIDKRLVKTKTIDSLSLKNIGFIKIDVEGHEESVILGGLKTIKEQRPSLLIEIEERHKKGSIESMVDILRSINYSCFFYAGDKIREFGEFTISKYQTYGKEPYVNNFIFIDLKSELYKKFRDIRNG